MLHKIWLPCQSCLTAIAVKSRVLSKWLVKWQLCGTDWTYGATEKMRIIAGRVVWLVSIDAFIPYFLPYFATSLGHHWQWFSCCQSKLMTAAVFCEEVNFSEPGFKDYHKNGQVSNRQEKENSFKVKTLLLRTLKNCSWGVAKFWDTVHLTCAFLAFSPLILPTHWMQPFLLQPPSVQSQQSSQRNPLWHLHHVPLWVCARVCVFTS